MKDRVARTRAARRSCGVVRGDAQVGPLLTRARLGDVVEAGEHLCSIVNIRGDEVETITAPARGVELPRICGALHNRGNSKIRKEMGLGRAIVVRRSTHGCVDFRKQIAGLASLVQDTRWIDPFFSRLIVFTNRRRAQCRIRYWERRIRGVAQASYASFA